MKLTVLIPAHNEESAIESTVTNLVTVLQQEQIAHEILVVNDNSRDRTESILKELMVRFSSVRYLNNTPPHGFGFAVRKGLEHFQGDAVAIYMADASDDPKDVPRFYRTMLEGYDCVFGSRWMKGGITYDYPWHKWVMNRLGNHFIRLILNIPYNDTTNAFKMFRRHVIDGCQPILSYHFNLTAELPLKAIVRGYTYAVLPNSWTNRKTGISKWNIQEMGSRYMFIVLYCLIEKWLSRQDYHSTRNPRNSDARRTLSQQ